MKNILTSLRIGSYVYTYDRKIGKVVMLHLPYDSAFSAPYNAEVRTEAYTDRHGVSNPSVTYPVVITEGIPLWGGVLEKSEFTLKHGGFYNLDRSQELGHSFGNISFEKYDDTQIRVWKSSTYIGILHCEYFHELQNIVYALTGHELTLTLDK